VPSLRSADERAEHQLQDGSLAERIRDDFESAALLDEETLEQIRGSNRPSMRHREAQMGDAGLGASVIAFFAYCIYALPLLTPLILLSQKVAADGEENHLFGKTHTSAMGGWNGSAEIKRW